MKPIADFGLLFFSLTELGAFSPFFLVVLAIVAGFAAFKTSNPRVRSAIIFGGAALTAMFGGLVFQSIEMFVFYYLISLTEVAIFFVLFLIINRALWGGKKPT